MNGDKKIVGFQLVVILWIMLEACWPKLSANGAANGIPGRNHYAAFDEASDCAIYRRVANRTREEVKGYKRNLGDVELLLQERRAALEQCAEENGVGRVETEDDDRRLAEVCDMAYRAWLTPGYRLQMLKEDIRSAARSLQTMSSVLQFQCGGPTLQRVNQQAISR